MVRDCMEVCSFVSDASVARESVTFCECRLPDLPSNVVQRCVFLWGSEETARMSRRRVFRKYPEAKFIDVPGYNIRGSCVIPDEETSFHTDVSATLCAWACPPWRHFSFRRLRTIFSAE